MDVWVVGGGCPEQPVNPTFPAAHPSSVFCGDLLRHVEIQWLLSGIKPRRDELSRLFSGLRPEVNSTFLSLWLSSGTETTLVQEGKSWVSGWRAGLFILHPLRLMLP